MVLVLSLAAALLAGGAWAKKPVKKHHARPAATAKAKPVPAAATRAAPAAATIAVPFAATAGSPSDPNLLTLQTVSGMASAGAPRIALKLMDLYQPDFAADAVGWMSWERERVYIYQSGGDWQAVIGRTQHLPAGVGGWVFRCLLIVAGGCCGAASPRRHQGPGPAAAADMGCRCATG